MTAPPAARVDVVVTGRGVVSSIGEGADAFFDALLAKRSGIEDARRRLHGVRSRARDDAEGGAPRRPLHAARGRRGGAGGARGRAATATAPSSPSASACSWAPASAG